MLFRSKQMKYGTSVAAIGLAGGAAIDGALITPFILRGVNLLGIDSVMQPYANRVRAWERIASDLPMDKLEAMSRAAPIRMRPVLMTAISTIFGVMPIALALGAGSQSRRPLGLAVVGGMAFSTMLTLFVVPVAHTMLMEAAEKLRGSASPTSAGDTDKPASAPPVTE